MALIEKNFSKNKTDKVNMIRRLQKATRFLHRVCNEVKLSQNVGMSRHVPGVKKCLDELIYRVKAMCAANNAGQFLHYAFNYEVPEENFADELGQDLVSEVFE